MFNTKQLEAIHNIKLNKNVFVTGSGGTGKSFILQYIIKWYYENNINIGVTASTGSAAFLINGKTIHSYLGIGLATASAEDLANKTIKKNYNLYNKLYKLQTLIIDEISMISADLFDKISKYLSIIKKNKKPFGGIQLILSGDFCQLPPVNGNYCFISDTWKLLNIQKIILNELVRQKNDDIFQNILEELRWGICSDKNFKILKELKNTNFSNDIIPTKLYPINVNVDKINNNELTKLLNTGATKYIYINRYSSHPDTKLWANSNKQPKCVELCIGAQVLVTYNIDNFIVNGTRGIIISLDTNYVHIKINKSNNQIIIIPYITIISNENENIFMSFMPLKLAYALSIHRCQGYTLDAIEIDIGSSIFEYGQAYVSLSRAKSLSSIKIIDIKKSSFKTHPLVKEFYNE